jgi:pumilio RNA-binding family
LHPECTDISLIDILPHIVIVGQDQNGALFLQARLLEASVEVKTQVINAVLETDIASLCTHRYGHAFITQLIDVATVEQRRTIADRLALLVKPISMDLHGCRVVQKALHTMPRDASERLFQGLRDSVVQGIKSMHANHVIQACIEEMPAASVMFIVNAVETWGVDAAATHIYGCRVIMRLLEHVPRPQMQRVLQQIAESVPKLAQDRYGNYVLQHVLKTCELPDKQAVMQAICRAGAFELAKQKYAHNVIEKCVELALDPDYAAHLTAVWSTLNDDLLGKGNCDYVMELADDRFGAMVVQCFLERLRGTDLQRLRDVLLTGEEHLRNLPHTDALLARLHVIL